jgi:hypothetical protein
MVIGSWLKASSAFKVNQALILLRPSVRIVFMPGKPLWRQDVMASPAFSLTVLKAIALFKPLQIESVSLF